MSGHTPGPWTFETYGASAYVFTATEKEEAICDLDYSSGDGGRDVEDGERALVRANARLIAAAPDLLEALKRLVSYTLACEGMLNASPAGQVTHAETVIAKAEGR